MIHKYWSEKTKCSRIGSNLNHKINLRNNTQHTYNCSSLSYVKFLHITYLKIHNYRRLSAKDKSTSYIMKTCPGRQLFSWWLHFPAASTFSCSQLWTRDWRLVTQYLMKWCVCFQTGFFLKKWVCLSHLYFFQPEFCFHFKSIDWSN